VRIAITTVERGCDASSDFTPSDSRSALTPGIALRKSGTFFSLTFLLVPAAAAAVGQQQAECFLSAQAVTEASQEPSATRRLFGLCPQDW
jgi:hypothetical protein